MFRKLFRIGLGVACICSCRRGSQDMQWDDASIVPAIDRNAVYVQLDKEREIFSALEHKDTSMKRSSGVYYFIKGHINLSDSNSARRNNCRAYFYPGDTLSIIIGIGTGLSGWGFVINYKAGKFSTRPYIYTDMEDPRRSEPVYEIAYQNLMLDKAVYKLGDSLYGKIDFKCIETGDAGRIEHSGKGYFRTKVRKPSEPS